MKNITIVLLFIFFVSCESNKTEQTQPSNNKKADSIKNIIPFGKKFYDHKNELNDIVLELKKSPLINSKSTMTIFVPNNFDPTLQNKMNNVGILEFLYYSTYCDSSQLRYSSTFQFDFTTNWSDKVPVHLNTKPCQDEENNFGSYFKRDNGNEGWGLGDIWVIWYEHFSAKKDSFPIPHHRVFPAKHFEFFN